MLHLTILPSSLVNLSLTRRLQLPFPQILALCDGSHALAEVLSPTLADLSSVPIISNICTIITFCFTVGQIRRWLQLFDGHECDVDISQSMFKE